MDFVDCIMVPDDEAEAFRVSGFKVWNFGF